MLNLCYIFKLTAILLPIRWGFLFLKCLRVFTSGKPIFILILLSKFYLYAYPRQGLRSGLALIYIGAISGLFYWRLIEPTRRLGLCGALLARRFLPNMSELLSFFFSLYYFWREVPTFARVLGYLCQTVATIKSYFSAVSLLYYVKSMFIL